MTRRWNRMAWVFVAGGGWTLAVMPTAIAQEGKPAPAASVEKAGAEERAETTERWYVVEMMGQKSGWMMSREERTKERITTTSDTRLLIKRGALEMKVRMASEFVETVEGKAISMKSVQELGSVPIEQEYVFKEDGLERRTRQGGKTTTAMLEKPKGEWMTPGAAERYIQERMKAKPKEITLRVIDPSAGPDPVSVKRSEFVREKVRALGREMELTKSTIEMSMMPGTKMYEWSDERNVMVKQETALGGIRMTMMLSTEEEAKGEVDAPEMMLSTFVKPEGRFEDARRTKRATLLLSVPDGEMVALPETGSQRVAKVDARSSRLTIDTAFPNKAPEEDAGEAKYLASTSMGDLNDEKIRELHARAVAGAGASAGERAEAMRKFVFTFIKKKSLGVGYASASETARSAEGDCSEHGVLLATLLRAEGIPSRVASGLIYADSFAGSGHIFGYHMWAQALLEVNGAKRWVDLDATLPAATPYDATHVTLVTADMADGQTAVQLAGMAPLLGRLQIKIEKAE